MDNEVPSADDFLQHLVNPTRIPQLEGPEARTALLHISGPASLPKRVWMEFKPFELRRKSTEPTEAVKQAAQRLARLLGHPKAQEAGFRTLRCISLLQLLKPNPAFALVFELPEDRFPAHRNPTTLLKSIESKTIDRPTLDQRFAMARCLVKTLFHLHSVDWLHKSIRSNNILFGYDPSSATRPDYSHPYLVGFEFSRDERDRSTTDQDDQLDRNIYRHPDRQGPPEKRFSAMHDHYALGVVLLEIGLWRPVLGFEEDYDEMSPDEIMLSLQEHAKDRLPHYMGLDYTEAVLACLNGSLQTRVTVGQTGMSDSQRLGLNLALLEKVLNKIKLRGGDPSISQS